MSILRITEEMNVREMVMMMMMTFGILIKVKCNDDYINKLVLFVFVED